MTADRETKDPNVDTFDHVGARDTSPAPALDVEDLADALVADLFQNGAGLKGERLAIMAGGIDHGGWSRAGFRDRVIKIMRGEVRS